MTKHVFENIVFLNSNKCIGCMYGAREIEQRDIFMRTVMRIATAK